MEAAHRHEASDGDGWHILFSGGPGVVRPAPHEHFPVESDTPALGNDQAYSAHHDGEINPDSGWRRLGLPQIEKNSTTDGQDLAAIERVGGGNELLTLEDCDQVDFLGVGVSVRLEQEFRRYRSSECADEGESDEFEDETDHDRDNTCFTGTRKTERGTKVLIAVGQPSAIKVVWSILRVLVGTTSPRPAGMGTVDHSSLLPVLQALSEGGLPAAAGRGPDVSTYLAKMSGVEPDGLSRDEALAYWLNLYNAGAVGLAIEAFQSGAASVFRVPDGFIRHLITVAGEELSLDAIEHGKVRRFGDPRIHGALVCGSLSCPTLRPTPYAGEDLDRQLNDQMKDFFAGGGAVEATPDSVSLSRILLWFGSDFVRPHRMPTFMPASKRRTLQAVRHWLPEHLQTRSNVEFQNYDWGLGCAVRPSER